MSETDDARFAMHQRSGCSREWFHDGPCAPDALWAKPAPTDTARVAALEDALDSAILSLHYASGHQSVPLGRLIATCTDDPCPKLRAALSPAAPEAMWEPSPKPETVARWFHEAYERLAPSFGYETRKASAVPWESVPEPNRSLMVAVAAEVRDRLLKP